MSVENGKVCCNCRHNIRKRDEKYGIVSYCEIKDYNLGYIQVMEGWCRHWVKEREKHEDRD